MGHAKLAQHSSPHSNENPGEALGHRWLDAMRRGDFAASWAVSDRVLACRDPVTRDDPALPYHLRWVWDGRAVDGQDVLVRCYHGLGDTLQFCRYLAPLRRRVRSLTLEVQPELAALLSGLPGPDRLIPFRPEAPAGSACDLEIMELAHALRLAPEPTPYIRGPAMARDGFGIRIGLCWHVASAWQPERSVPLDLLATLQTVPRATLVSLQRGPGAEALLAPGAPQVVNPADRSTDIMDTVRLLAGLDLVVTIDTMVAHLAGALGLPVWLLLPHAPDWRWLAGERGSPWYRSVRKYRQAAPGDWSGPVAELVSDLTRLVADSSLEHGTLRGMAGL